jgi:hypothetical protein
VRINKLNPARRPAMKLSDLALPAKKGLGKPPAKQAPKAKRPAKPAC